MNSFLIGISTWISPEVSSPGQGALWESRPRFLSGTSLQRCHRSWPDVPMTSLAEAFRLGRGCFGREGVLRGTGTFPETGGTNNRRFCCTPRRAESRTVSSIWFSDMLVPLFKARQERLWSLGLISVSLCAMALPSCTGSAGIPAMNPKT